MSTHHIYTKRHPQPQYQATDNEYDTESSSSSSSSHHNNMSRTSGPNAEIADGITNLQKKNAKLERMMVKIGTKADTHEFRDKMTDEQKSAAILCKTLMNQMKQNTRADKQVMNKLTTQFDREWKKYQALVYDMDQKMKQVLNTVSHQDDDRSHTHDQDDDYRQSQLQQQDMAIQFLEYDAQEIEQRHQQIAALESDVLEVAEMYKDLQIMVNEQQESIDVIENNIVATRDKTEAAAQELLEAESYQKKARRKKCCIVLILLAVITAIIVVVVLLNK